MIWRLLRAVRSLLVMRLVLPFRKLEYLEGTLFLRLFLLLIALVCSPGGSPAHLYRGAVSHSANTCNTGLTPLRYMGALR